MQIQCKTTGCPGHVDYQPQTVPLSLFSTAFEGADKLMAETIPLPHFEKAVSKIVEDRANRFNSTEIIFLTCDNTATGPHTNSYDVPVKI
jgi:hypothetical protein